MPYQHDVFISYRRVDMIESFTREFFHPLFKKYLELYGYRTFLDVQIESGRKWPNEISEALCTSRLMLAIVAPVYFSSAWCLAEWQTMLRRQETVWARQAGVGPLVLPLSFIKLPWPAPPPADLAALQMIDISHCVGTKNRIKSAPVYRALEVAIQNLVDQVVHILNQQNFPPHDPAWPVIQPEGIRPEIELYRIGAHSA